MTPKGGAPEFCLLTITRNLISTADEPIRTRFLWRLFIFSNNLEVKRYSKVPTVSLLR